MRVIFLYTELAGYSLTCMKETLKLYPDTEIHVVRWPVNQEAPFQFDFETIRVYEKEEFSLEGLKALIKGINPQAIICSGWIDKEYNSICKYYVKRIPVVLTLDNHWIGNAKQRIASLLSGIVVRNKFNKAWVPGKKQFLFAEKLGFKKKDIELGFYSADVELFQNYGQVAFPHKEVEYPKVMLYVGRYVQHKGIFDIWEAFVELQQTLDSDWELWSVGTGDQWEQRTQHDKIRHFGFIQPDEFQEIINQASIYLLPSHFEPWGVSLHEFTAAGFPVLVSDAVGSSEKFCDEGVNGFKFQNGNKEELKQKMQKIMQLSQEEYLAMQNRSRELSLQITPATWAKTLMNLING